MSCVLVRVRIVRTDLVAHRIHSNLCTFFVYEHALKLLAEADEVAVVVMVACGLVLSDSGQSVYSWRLFICCVAAAGWLSAVCVVRCMLCVVGVGGVGGGGGVASLCAGNLKRNMFEL